MKTIAIIALLTTVLNAPVQASPTVTHYPTITTEFSHSGTSVFTSSSSSSSATGSEVNGVCTYSYTINGITYGPYQENAPTCNISTSTSSINGVTTTTVKLNGSKIN